MLTARLGEQMLAELRERFVDRVLDLPLGTVERAGSGTSPPGSAATSPSWPRRSGTALPQLARSLLTIGLTLVALVALDWRFLLAALLAVPVQLHTVRWYVRRAWTLYARQRVALGALQQQLLDTIGGAGTVRAFRLTDAHLARVGDRSRHAVDLTLRGRRLMTRFYGRLNVAEFVGFGRVWSTGFLLVRAEEVSVGTAAAAALYFHNLFNPLNAALGLVDDTQSAAAGWPGWSASVDYPPRRGPATAAGPPRPARPTRTPGRPSRPRRGPVCGSR